MCHYCSQKFTRKVILKTVCFTWIICFRLRDYCGNQKCSYYFSVFVGGEWREIGEGGAWYIFIYISRSVCQLALQTLLGLSVSTSFWGAQAGVGRGGVTSHSLLHVSFRPQAKLHILSNNEAKTSPGKGLFPARATSESQDVALLCVQRLPHIIAYYKCNYICIYVLYMYVVTAWKCRRWKEYGNFEYLKRHLCRGS